MKTAVNSPTENDPLASLLEELDHGLEVLRLCRQYGLPDGKLKSLTEHIVDVLDQIDSHHFGGSGLRQNLLPA